MNTVFTTQDLADLYEDSRGPYARRLPSEVKAAFFRCMLQIEGARDERDLRTFKGRRFEKVPSECDGCYSMRLNDQWRIVFTIETVDGEKTVVIRDVKDYH